MYKKILIISDNSFLCKKFHHIIDKKKLDCNFTFSISPFSDKDDFNLPNETDVEIFNLKNQEDVDFIIRNYDLVFSIHCKQIFPVDLVTALKCVNVHPGYNPINRGWYPQIFSIINDLPIGATIHEIDEKLDHGHIIAREFVNKYAYDTSESLYNRVVDKEIELLENNIESIIKNDYKKIKPESEGNLFLKKDFNELLELDLNEQISIGDFINRLRALTHGNYDNAYFIDSKTNKKVFIGVRLKSE